jgi:tetratricopeptide (TPR) repeat protein
MLKLGIAYYNLRDNASALVQYKKLVDQYPNSPEAEDALGDVRVIYLEESKPEEYAEFMRQAGRPISVNTEDSLTYAAAENQYINGVANAALSGFDSYLQKFPSGAYALDASFYRGELYAGRKDWKNALAGYEPVAANAPNKFAERAILAAARIYFFELKDYARAEAYYVQLNQVTSSQENKLEAMRGLLRSQYQQEKWADAATSGKELVALKGSSSDDKALANMAVAKSYQVDGKYDLAIANYKSVILLNKAALGAEARYSIAESWFRLGKMNDAEKAAFETINKSGSYGFWVTKAYILLGDIYFHQKDYFNAKATFQSIVDNSIDPDLKSEAQEKLNQVIEEESRNSKVEG